MSKRTRIDRMALAALALGASSLASAQSPYGLGARQTIPWVMELQDERGFVWDTEVNIHNPSNAPMTVEVTYLGAVNTPAAGAQPCQPQTVGPQGTIEFSVAFTCLLPWGFNYGRLELSALTPGPASLDPAEPSDQIFLANARVWHRDGSIFAVEGFPEGYLSGNKASATATGLKNGFFNGDQWQTFCAAAGLNDATTVVVRLFDGNGNPIGNAAGALLDPPKGIEMQAFPDVFAAVGAPPGNYGNVTATFSPFVPNREGVFGVCMIVDASTNRRAFEVAKYVDDNDEARQFLTQENRTAFGSQFSIVSEVQPQNPVGFSDLHVAYFQHPDRVTCAVRWSPGVHPTSDQLQMRLIDPDGVVVAGGPSQSTFTFDLGEKPTRYRGRNGRWLVEVAPDRTYDESCSGGFNLCSGGLDSTDYSLTCASGNGHNALDVSGHCRMTCTPDAFPPGTKDFHCAFAPFDGSSCQAF